MYDTENKLLLNTSNHAIAVEDRDYSFHQGVFKKSIPDIFLHTGLSCVPRIDAMNVADNPIMKMCLGHRMNISNISVFPSLVNRSIPTIASSGLISSVNSSPKHISWCLTIKYDIFTSFDLVITHSLDSDPETVRFGLETEIAQRITTSSYYISEYEENISMLALAYTFHNPVKI